VGGANLTYSQCLVLIPSDTIEQRNLLYQLSQEGNLALLNQGMNANCAGSHAKVSLALGFKNTRKEDSYLKSANAKNLYSTAVP
jgi:hypothetical protein